MIIGQVVLHAGDTQSLPMAMPPQLARAIEHSIAHIRATAPSSHPRDPLEHHLHQQIDSARDLITTGSAKTALGRLDQLLITLPGNASAHILFRLKANIGFAHIRLGDSSKAAQWLIESHDHTPDDPRAVANKALALFLRRENTEAVDFARQALFANPSNEMLAAYFIQGSAALPAISDPMLEVPAGLRSHQDILLAELVFHRIRDHDDVWCSKAQVAAERFPANKSISLLAAEAKIIAIGKDGRHQITHDLGEDVRTLLVSAAEALTAEWDAFRESEQLELGEHVSCAVSAMIGFQMAGFKDRATAIALQLVDKGIKEPGPVFNIAQVLADNREHDAADRALAMAVESPQLQFMRGIRLLERGRWAEAARVFEGSEMPAVERAIVDAVIALAPLQDKSIPADEQSFRATLPKVEKDPRGLIAFARVARRRGFPDIADEAFARARKAITDETNMAARLMTASYAADDHRPTTVIELLTGKIPIDRDSHELEMLAVAHALERPRRPRNEVFFRSLPPHVAALPSVARAHVAVLLDLGKADSAIELLEQQHAQAPHDAYVILRLAEAYARTKGTDQLDALARSVTPELLEGPPEHCMGVAQMLRQRGRTEEAVVAGYDLLRNHAHNPRVVLGYTGLFLMDPSTRAWIEPTTVAIGGHVQLESEAGQANGFVIDEGAAFWGIEVRHPDDALAQRAIGKKKGDSFQLARRFDTETWKIKEVKSKYLAALHVIMDEFEQRFPHATGLWQLRMRGEDITPLLEATRDIAEKNRETAGFYIEQRYPLAFVARMLGGDVISFAEYVRGEGYDLHTCLGHHQEREAALALAQEWRSKRATLDTYTAFVAADLDILPLLKNWFGELFVASSTVQFFDRFISRETEKLGRENMSIGWHKGKFIRQISTDADIQRTIAGLGKTRDRIAAVATVIPVLLPDDLPETATNLASKLGAAPFEPMYLANARNTVLLSDDMGLRDIASELTGCVGLWLQPVLGAALNAGLIDRATYSSHIARLAAHGHHVSVSPEDFAAAFDDVTDVDLTAFGNLAGRLGGRSADMRSHSGVAITWMLGIWRNEQIDENRRERATSMVLRSLLRARHTDWAVALGYVAAAIQHLGPLLKFVDAWVTGHFLPKARVLPAFRHYQVRFLAGVKLAWLPRDLRNSAGRSIFSA